MSKLAKRPTARDAKIAELEVALKDAQADAEFWTRAGRSQLVADLHSEKACKLLERECAELRKAIAARSPKARVRAFERAETMRVARERR